MNTLANRLFTSAVMISGHVEWHLERRILWIYACCCSFIKTPVITFSSVWL